MDIPTPKQPFYKRKANPYETQIILRISVYTSNLVLRERKGIGEIQIYISNVTVFFLSFQGILIKEWHNI